MAEATAKDEELQLPWSVGLAVRGTWYGVDRGRHMSRQQWQGLPSEATDSTQRARLRAKPRKLPRDPPNEPIKTWAHVLMRSFDTHGVFGCHVKGYDYHFFHTVKVVGIWNSDSMRKRTSYSVS